MLVEYENLLSALKYQRVNLPGAETFGKLCEANSYRRAALVGEHNGEEDEEDFIVGKPPLIDEKA